MNIYFLIVMGLILLRYLLQVVSDLANLRHVRTEIPGEFDGVYNNEKYAESQRYLKDNARFDILQESIMLPVTILFIACGGFRWIDEIARSAGFGMIGTGLAFGGLLLLLSLVIGIPFQVYATFVLEQRYGFNKTRWTTFIGDQLKGLILSLLLGAAVFSGILWFFSQVGPWAWVYSWLAVVAFQIVLMYVAPVVILPLFNKFTPLEEGGLKESIFRYAHNQGFDLKGIFTMDGSRRSTKSNAYFTGFGKWRRIVLYDTLVEKHETDELVSVLAHEIGHYKLKHIRKQLVTGIFSTGLLFYMLSLFLTQPVLYRAFHVEMTPIGGDLPIYAGMVFFGFLYTPISLLLSLIQNYASRRHEFEADAFAVKTFERPDAFILALKRLSVDNLSNLTPHPLKVFLEYSHPPVLARIETIRRIKE